MRLTPDQQGEADFLTQLLARMALMQDSTKDEFEAKHLAVHRAEMRARLDSIGAPEDAPQGAVYSQSGQPLPAPPARPAFPAKPKGPAFPAASQKVSDRREAV